MKSLFNKKALTIIGTALVLIGIPLTTFLLKNQTVFKSDASTSQEPRNVKITNVSDRSFTVTYQTELPSTGSVNYGDDKKLVKSGLEDADREKGSFSPKTIHSISVKELTPATNYYLTIVSGPNTFLNNGAPFEITTGENISSPSAEPGLMPAKLNTIKGKILLPDGNTPSEALVYLNAESSQTLSSTTTKDGGFSFSLKELRTNNLSSYFNANENTVFKIEATNGTLKSVAFISLTENGSIPPITLSNNYDFTQKTSPAASKSAETSGFPSAVVSGEIIKPEIISPRMKQSLDEQKPQFSGTGLPNEKVEIIINSEEEITATVIADRNGRWEYKPSVNLSPGEHTVTIKTRDSSGILTTVMQSFTVFAADSQVSEPTPSATPITTTTSNLTTTPTVILTPFPSPTNIPIPTAIPTIPPTGASSAQTIGSIGTAITIVSLIAFFLIHKRISL